MTSKGLFAIVKRMAVLWKQREVLRTVEVLTKESIEREKPSDLSAVRHISYYGAGDYWILENDVIRRMLDKRHKLPSDDMDVIRLKRIINTCIEDGYLEKDDNPDFGKDEDIFGNKLSILSSEKSSLRKLRITDDKGSELLNWWYFWFKYVADELPPLATIGTQIAITVITTILTSGAIWFYIINYVLPK
jgi:hypothetical protein